MNTSDIVRNNIKELLKKNGKTQAELAEALNVSPVYISYIVTGKKAKDLKISMIEEIANFFNISVYDLMNVDMVILQDSKLERMYNELKDNWKKADDIEKGVLLVLFKQMVDKYNEMSESAKKIVA